MKPKLRKLGGQFIYAIKLKKLVAMMLITIFCVANIAVTIIIQKSFLPTVTAYACDYATVAATEKMYNAVSEAVTAENYTYGDFYTIVRDSGGGIRSIELNTSKINLFKTNVAKYAKVKTDGEQILKIPSGNFFNHLFFMGRGPKLNIKLSNFGYTTAEISGSFSSAGINQTKHSVVLTVKSTVSVVLPYRIEKIDVETVIPVAETVIVGDVPDLYPLSSQH